MAKIYKAPKKEEAMRVCMQASLLVLAAAVCLVLSCASTDVGLGTTVKAKLVADDTVKASQIEVQVNNGVVTLEGNVDSDAAKSRALQLARETKGVTRVVDMLSARTASGAGDAPEPQRTAGVRIDDASITVGVKTRLLDDPVVKGLKIDVDTRDGVVYLTGKVGSEAEKAQAIRLARGAEGVRDVQANLTIVVG